MRLSEIYTSVQGEGPGVGHMTQFIRFAGCNLRCPGWPCDTQHAIDPAKYRHEWIDCGPQHILDQLPEYPKRVTLTGGEPFLQPQREMLPFIEALNRSGYFIEVFTNGTLRWPPNVGYWNPQINIIMDWKLPGSGEDPYNETRAQNLQKLGAKDAVKFVMKDEEDFKQAVHTVRELRRMGHRIDAQIYYGAVWGAIDSARLVELVQQERLDWKLNVQVHNYIYDRDQRGI